MPRRRIPNVSVPRRPDQRRSGGNGIDAQRAARRGRPGQVEAIVERRARVFELRRSGATYREISRQVGADLHTVHADIQAELLAIRSRTIQEALDLRAIECERLDAMTSALWPGIQQGNAANVSAGVRISERRAKLLGLDSPVVMKGEITGSLGVYTERLAAEVELFAKLDVAQLEELARESEALVAKARAMARGQHVARIEAAVPGAPVVGESSSGAAEMPIGIDVDDT